MMLVNEADESGLVELVVVPEGKQSAMVWLLLFRAYRFVVVDPCWQL